MKRLRPPIPIAARFAAAARQLNATGWAEALLHPKNRTHHLEMILGILFGNTPTHCDHNPPLAARPYDRRRAELAVDRFNARRISAAERNRIIADCYKPNANDPAHLEHRPAAPEAERSHYVKTYVRGDNGQLSDRMLINRERRREKPTKKAKKSTWPKRPFPRRSSPWSPPRTN